MGYTLLIDNYDSFTWNIYSDLATLGGNPLVRRNDKITIEEVEAMYNAGDLDRICISPGPGHPKTDSGISREVITWGMGKVPILGVCMGLECLVDVLGGEIAYAGEIKHGKTSLVEHDALGIFHSLPPLLASTRYHSLSASILSLPKELQVSATTKESGVIMGVRHRTYCVEAVQYHPESCMSEGGRGLAANFLKMKGGTWSENAWCGVEAAPKGSATALVNGSASSPSAPRVPTILENIRAQRLVDVEQSQSAPATTPAILSTSLSLHTAPSQINLIARLTSTPHTAIMAEIKRASPSKGDIAISTNAPEQAIKYALAGASVISVLTEPKWFKGSLSDMLSVRQALESLPNRPAVLRKDFILSTYMIDEARLHGADTVLLIVAMLDRPLLEKLYRYSLSLGMEPLVEVNNPDELQTALEIGAKVIGVNNRNLHDFNVDMSTTSRVNAALQGRDVILCALSGISSPEDVQKYVKEGVKAVLVGESLMRAPDPFTFLRSLISLPPLKPVVIRPLVKICGCRSVADAKVALAAGADMIGVILVPGTKRQVTHSVAGEISRVVRSSSRASTSTVDPSQPWFTFHASHLASRRRPQLVGVFRNQPLPEILDAVDTIGLDMVQLHGDEPQSWARFIPVPVIKVFRVDHQGKISGGEVDRPGLNQFALLDAGDASGGGGGEGKTFDWSTAKSIVQSGQVGSGGRYPLPVILAGGLTPENVVRALEEVPGVLAVDVSSGTDSSDGCGKDPSRVKAFIDAVRATG
ncbi:N-anthranilate isomerase [Kockovaella imperatae]|uniref:Multifunctional tryptophan biosynthesis protein n=1 Tax=Kockovaella imperatae TaxID=4999 RepID=A0A1Y1UBY7_9TREE|nr:N-anthranilate isomerase [Kockovaella imperatae]ORX35558.1 N-anthranilate isomerase [Kockovaella imperatae]